MKSTFGGVRLTAKEWIQFERQIAEQEPNVAAIESLRKGIELVREFEKYGVVRVIR